MLSFESLSISELIKQAGELATTRTNIEAYNKATVVIVGYINTLRENHVTVTFQRHQEPYQILSQCIDNLKKEREALIQNPKTDPKERALLQGLVADPVTIQDVINIDIKVTELKCALESRTPLTTLPATIGHLEQLTVLPRLGALPSEGTPNNQLANFNRQRQNSQQGIKPPTLTADGDANIVNTMNYLLAKQRRRSSRSPS